SDESVAIYIHIPYCPSRCLYCSFPSGIMPDNDEFQQNFCLGVEEDIAAVVQLISMHGLSVNSVYIGGGTPTSLSDKYFARLIAKAAILLDYGCDVEFTVEAGRPDTFSLEKLVIMKEFGVDRISINSQTMHERTLALIGRNHSIKSLIDAVNATQRVGIKHINMDLIIGLPNETVGDITYSVREVLDLEPDNFTVHTLALKNGAPLYDCQNKYSFIGMQEVEQLLTEIKTMASKQAYFPYYLYRQHYMLSQVANIGFAKDGTECLYNIIMMGEYGSVIGAGLGAATKILAKDGYHLSKLYLPKNYGEYQKEFKQLLAKREKMFINRYEWGNR
ncbi:MAG TPA: coproporphyrinogen dehydrogenase HemZ, partial [Candidatus Avacidaminococcus intestinavium]|nr:coproporphyrinogen dehydrogenase HemZ [Candidatus Avacidaminococcus intestinavium]